LSFLKQCKTGFVKTLPTISIIAFMFLAGCARHLPDVATHVQPGSHLRTDFIPENLLDTPSSPSELVWLHAARVFKSRSEFDYFLEVKYMADVERGWLDIQPGESLVIMADGRVLTFRSSGSANSRRERRGIITEDALYRANAWDLRAIAQAEAVTVRVMGRNGVVEREFSPQNFERFRKFVQYYVDSGV
jgi:hypothetical protein